MDYERFWRAAYPAVNKACSLFDHVKVWDKNYFDGETGYWQVFYKLAITKKM